MSEILYGNWLMVAPDGTMMCRCDQRKAAWYLDRDLAEIVEPFTIRLKFIPKGKGKSDDPYYLAVKENICVCCGSKENLTKHHCVPRCFRVFFPPEYKEHRSHDVLLLCSICHTKYESQAEILKLKLLEQYRIPCKGSSVASEEYRNFCSAAKAGFALLHFKDRMPEARVKFLYSTISEFLGREPTDADILEISERVCPSALWAKRVVEKIEISEFEKMWRSHFVQTMHPKFLPLHWRVDHWDISKK